MSAASKPTLGATVKVTGPGSPTIDTSFIDKTGRVTAVYAPDESYNEESYQVTLPDGRHDMFFVDELEVRP